MSETRDNFEDETSRWEGSQARGPLSGEPTRANSVGEVFSEVTDAELDSLLMDLERFNDDQASVIMPLAALSEQTPERIALEQTQPSEQQVIPRKLRKLFLASELPPPVEDSQQIEIHASPDDKGAAAAMASFKIESSTKSAVPDARKQQLSERVELLKGLADFQQGSVRAGLLVSAAELCEQVGNVTQARKLYKKALEASPLDIVALRALRRDALTRKSWTQAAEFLETEASLPLNVEERALALVFLAELQCQKLHNPQAAIAAAKQALALRPQTVSAALLLINLYLSAGDEAQAYGIMQQVAYHWSDKFARSAMFVECARFAERQGDVRQARHHFEAAFKLDPTALDVAIGIARTARSTSDTNRVIEALEIAASLAPVPTQEALRLIRSRWLHLAAARSKEALRIVESSRHPLAVKTRVDIHLAKGNLERATAALRDWADLTGGSDRAVALAELAFAHLQQAKTNDISQVLQDAALADGTVGSIRALRELLARRHGDPLASLAEERRNQAPGSLAESPIKRAAHLVHDPRGLSEELHWLKRAAQDDEDAICADVLLLDVACSMRDEQNIAVGLENQALRAPPARRIGVLLALSELAARSGDHERAETILEQARDLAPDQPVVLRPLGRLKHAKGPHMSAELWLQEARACDNGRAAFAATMAARLFLESQQDLKAMDALQLAFKCFPTYQPAVWTFERMAWRQTDQASLARLYENLAENAIETETKLGYLLTAVLRLREMKSPHLVKVIEKLLDLAPNDPILVDMSIRLGALHGSAKAELLVTQAKDCSAAFARALLLRAIWEFGPSTPTAESQPYMAQLRADSSIGDPFISRLSDQLVSPNAAIENCLIDLQQVQEDATPELLNRLTALELQMSTLPAASVPALQRFSDHQPGHLSTLRKLYRYYIENDRGDAEVAILARLSEALASPQDQASAGRCAARRLLAPSSARPSAADRILLRIPRTALSDAWIARRVSAGAAYAKHLELSADATQQLAACLTHPLEKAATSLRAARFIEQTHGSTQAAAYLENALPEEASHSVAFEELARMFMLAKEAKAAARHYENAARLAQVPQHALALWHRAGMLWHDEVGDQAKALQALQRAGEIDITFADIFDRLRRLLDDHGELKDLAELTRSRLSAGGSPKILVELHVQLADLYRRLGKAADAKTQLETALSLEPDHLNALRTLAELYVMREEWKDAADAYIRIARLSRDHEELHRIFFVLGDIYDQHATDLKRSEAAFRRVIKLVPNDMLATQRLADIYMRMDDLDRAVETLQRLIDLDGDPDRNRHHRLQLAQAFERMGNVREAEQTLELARKNAPADLVVMESLAEFYERQGAQSAYLMHLTRATDDFRQAIRNDLSDAAAWHGLVKVLHRRGRADAAKACASAALAAGVVDIELSRLLSSDGAAPIIPSAAPGHLLDQLLAPDMLSPAVRTVFALTVRAMDKMFPLDLKAFRAKRLSRRDPTRMAAQTVADWLVLSTVQVYVTDAAARICVPLTDSPPSIMVSQDLLGSTTDAERVFLIARALKVVSSSLAVTARTSPYDIALALAAVVRCFDPEFCPPGMDLNALTDCTAQFKRHLSKRALQELKPHARGLAVMQNFDPGALGALALQIGSRYALTVTGSGPAAVNALLKLNGEADPTAHLAMRVVAIREVPEISSLLNFAISDEHFEARRQIVNPS